MLLNDLERLRNTLLAARQSVLLASADAGDLHPLWLAGYEAALVTVAVAFGLECRAIGLNRRPYPTVRLIGEGDGPDPQHDHGVTKRDSQG